MQQERANKVWKPCPNCGKPKHINRKCACGRGAEEQETK